MLFFVGVRPGHISGRQKTCVNPFAYKSVCVLARFRVNPFLYYLRFLIASPVDLSLYVKQDLIAAVYVPELTAHDLFHFPERNQIRAVACVKYRGGFCQFFRRIPD